MGTRKQEGGAVQAAPPPLTHRNNFMKAPMETDADTKLADILERCRALLIAEHEDAEIDLVLSIARDMTLIQSTAR